MRGVSGSRIDDVCSGGGGGGDGCYYYGHNIDINVSCELIRNRL